MMIKNYILVLLFLGGFILHSIVYSQACCTAGTPLMSTLDASAVPADTWNVSFSYDYNKINAVISGSKEIKGFRSRLSQSFLSEISYGLNSRISLTALFSYVMQSRQLSKANSFGSFQKVTSRGIGDAVLLAKYNIFPLTILDQQQLSAGLGVKTPSGRSSLKNNGTLLSADMQPGSGSWDGILWLYYFKGFLPITRFHFFANSSYKFNGANDQFNIGSTVIGYKFGNEVILSAGTSYSTESLFNFSLITRYRYSRADKLGSLITANTGGHWLYLNPGINVNFDAVSFRINGRIPVYRRLTGIQLTTSYSASASVFYSFSKN